MADARSLLARARAVYDAPANGLAAASAAAARGGFAGGAEWMRAALGVLRGAVPPGQAAFTSLGVAKYALACAAAVAVVGVAWASRAPALLPLAIVAFYVVEVRMVFAFPLALDGERQPLRRSHALVARTEGALAATATVMRIA